jgi:putative peptidoglycan lipid II flippase
LDRKKHIARAAGLMSVATFISRILGYVRDMIFALYFGATGFSDTFFAAFRIPNLLRELFAEGSMSAAFIPVLTEYRQKEGEAEAGRLVKITFTFIIIIVGIICFLGIVFSPAIVTVIAPGFLDSPQKFSLTVLLTRVMFPFLLFISLAALVMGALNTKKVFFIPTVAPAMLNITLILSIIFFESRAKQPLTVAAIGVLAGGLVQFAFQLPSFFKNGYRLGFDATFSHPGLKKMSILLIPRDTGFIGQPDKYGREQHTCFISAFRKYHLPLLFDEADSVSHRHVWCGHGNGGSSHTVRTCGERRL